MTFKAMIAEEADFKNLVRYIPTGSKTITKLGHKSLKITVIQPISAPPLTTLEIPKADKKLRHNVEMFINDVKREIMLSSVDEEKYVFIKGLDKEIQLIFTFTLNIKDKKMEKELKKLDDALTFSKNFKIKE